MFVVIDWFMAEISEKEVLNQKKEEKSLKQGGLSRFISGKSVIFALFIVFLILLVIIAIFVSTQVSVPTNLLPDTDVALIKIKGPILVDGGGSYLGGESVSSTKVIEFIEAAGDDDNIGGILLEINSPGGSAVASDEISQALKRFRAEHNKTSVAWVREVGASGAYWIASTTDHIIVNKMTITGSIGVIASYLEFSEFMDKYGIKYQRMVSGKYKDLGTPFKELEDEERELFQTELDKIHDYFIEEVATNRKLTKEQVEELATGRIFLGIEAFENGLADELGGKKQAIEYFEEKLGHEVELVEYQEPVSLLHILRNVFSEHGYKIGEGISSSLIAKEGLVKT